MLRRVSVAGAIVCSLALLYGCGNSRTPVPNIAQPVTPHGFKRDTFGWAGISFRAPSNWFGPSGHPPLAVLFSGTAVIALRRYPRLGSALNGLMALQQARIKLIAAAEKRAPSLTVIRSRLTSIGSARAIVLDATERISGGLRRVRSMHIYISGAELVLEEYTPPDLFHTVDREVFSPLNRSLRLLGSRAGHT